MFFYLSTFPGRLEDEYFKTVFFYNKQRFTEAHNGTMRFGLMWSGTFLHIMETAFFSSPQI